MSKKETFFIRFIAGVFMMTPLYGEISVGILKSIENNADIRFLSNNAQVICKPFGIITLENTLPNAPNRAECSAQIAALFRSSPHDIVFAREHLKISQSYHFEQIKEGCVLYANGLESYSEMLLAGGLAIVDPKFDNAEWNMRLKRSYQGAQKQKKGLHNTTIPQYCIKGEE